MFSVPDLSLDRGVWEAPRWAFFAAMGVVLVLAALYLARRVGWLRLRRARAKEDPR